MENLQINKTEQSKPVMENKIREWRRTTFENHDAKNWCYRKFKEKSEWGNDYYYDEYYCSNPSCKNQLIFQYIYEKVRSYPPFRFHQLLVKKLEKKEDDWKTGRKINIYYALCCKCAIDYKDNPLNKKVRKWAGMTLENQILDSCDCQEWINKQRTNHQQENIKYSEKVRVSDEIIKGLEKMKEKDIRGKYLDNYKNNQLDYYLDKENKERENNLGYIKNNNSYLIELTQWENKRQQQLQEI